MIELNSFLFQVQIEGVPGHAIEPSDSALGMAPEALNAPDANSTSGQFIVAAAEPQLLVKVHIDQAVIVAPPICMDGAGNFSVASNRACSGRLGASGTISLDTVIALE